MNILKLPGESFERLDSVVLWGTVSLLVFTPVALGAVHAWAFRSAEGAVFVLFLLWMLRSIFECRRSDRVLLPAGVRQLIVPTIALFVVMGFSVVPLHPQALSLLSGGTYRFYRSCLRGWPVSVDYDADPVPSLSAVGPAVEGSTGVELPTIDEVNRGSRVPFQPANDLSGAPVAAAMQSGGWTRTTVQGPSGIVRTLSLAPGVSYGVLLGAAAYVCFFALVAFYPFGDEDRAIRSLLLAFVVIGAAIASLGLLGRAFWNGKILWIFVPRDWDGPQLNYARALGPFVNPDHFAQYLCMLLPLAIASAAFGMPLPAAGAPKEFRTISAGATLAIACAVLLSLSRSAWAATALMTGVFLLIVNRYQDNSAGVSTRGSGECASAGSELDGCRHGFRNSRIISAARASRRLAYGSLTLGIIVTALALLGAQGRRDIVQRIGEALSSTDVSLPVRISVWKDTIRMIRDFPVFGVGLGSWPVVLLRYQSPPWSEYYYFNHAHNDYLELCAELGLIGLLAAGWWCWRTVKMLRSGSECLSAAEWPWFAALICGGMTAILHESLDFGLRTPANAFLLSAIVGLALRMVAASSDNSGVVWVGRNAARASTLAAALGACVLVFATFIQPVERYPDNRDPRSLAEARALVRSHPTYSEAHISLARFDRNATTDWALRESEIAVWLDPTNPYARDLYVQSLLAHGQIPTALRQIRLSVALSPNRDTHPFLRESMLGSLSVAERESVERGFKDAIEKKYPDSVQGLAEFYLLCGRSREAAEIYAQAARGEHRNDMRLNFLVAAGEAYCAAREGKRAEQVFQSAIESAPDDRRPYLNLLTLVYGPAANMTAAQATVREGIRNGVDSGLLYSTLADISERAGDRKLAEQALGSLVEESPTYSNLERLAKFLIAGGKFDRAIQIMRRATDVDPGSADGYLYLAIAEEGAYRYSAAAKAYRRAISIEPKNAEIAQRYAAFEHKVAAQKSETAGSL